MENRINELINKYNQIRKKLKTLYYIVLNTITNSFYNYLIKWYFGYDLKQKIPGAFFCARDKVIY